MQRIALFGGSFDPPTRGHAATVSNVLNSGLVDAVWIAPAGDDRYDRPLRASAPDRRRLVELLLEDCFPGDSRVRIEPAQLEGKLPGSATVDLFDYLKASYPSAQYFFVIGADNLAKVVEWREFSRLSKELRFLVVPRLGEHLPAEIPPYATVIEGGVLSGVSSSAARERVARGEVTDDLLSPGVRDFIAAHRLYRHA